MIEVLHTSMSQRALLIFADNAQLDLARRRLPVAALPLLVSPVFRHRQMLRADVHVFGAAPARARADRQFHQQRGHGFAERFENAIETLAALGYEEIVAIGRDCPALAADDIAQAFERLGDQRLVLGPDHRGGCYLIAFRAADRALLRGIRWKRNTDCMELVTRAGASAVALLPIKHDIDSWADVRLFARLGSPLSSLAAFLVRVVGAVSSAVVHFVDLAAHFVRVRRQMPPPRALV